MSNYTHLCEQIEKTINKYYELPKEIFTGSIDALDDVVNAADLCPAHLKPKPKHPTFFGLKLFEDENLPDDVIEVRSNGQVLIRMGGVRI